MNDYDVIELIKNKYLSNHKENTLIHVEEVADTAIWLGEIYHLDIIKLTLTALLHDISAIMSPQAMYELAKSRNLEIDPAEEKFHFLLHQKISKIITEEVFNISDPDILSAIECHTTLKRNANMYDKIIFIADKISWDQKGVPPYYDLVKSTVTKSLDEACYLYIKYQFDHNLLLMPHQWIIDAYNDLKSMKEQYDN